MLSMSLGPRPALTVCGVDQCEYNPTMQLGSSCLVSHCGRDQGVLSDNAVWGKVPSVMFFGA